MNYEQKIEIVNIYAGANHQKRIDDEQSLGWAVVSSSLSHGMEGKQMTLTFRRNTNLKLYERFLDIDHKIKVLRGVISKELEQSFQKSYKQRFSLPMEGIFSGLLLVGIIVLDIYTLLALFLTKNWGYDTFFGLLFLLSMIGGFHYLQRLWAKRIKRLLSDEETKIRIKELEDKIESLLVEARSLDHSIKD